MTRSEAHERRLAALAKARVAHQFQPLDPAGVPSARLSGRVPQSLLERLDEAVAASGSSRSEALREAITEWLDRRARRRTSA